MSRKHDSQHLAPYWSGEADAGLWLVRQRPGQPELITSYGAGVSQAWWYYTSELVRQSSSIWRLQRIAKSQFVWWIMKEEAGSTNLLRFFDKWVRFYGCWIYWFQQFLKLYPKQMLEFLSPINRYLLDYRLGILLRITGSQIIYGHLYHWSTLGWLDLSLVGLWNCDRGIVHWTKNHCHCGWMSLCLLTLLDPEVYTFILIRISDKA